MNERKVKVETNEATGNLLLYEDDPCRAIGRDVVLLREWLPALAKHPEIRRLVLTDLHNAEAFEVWRDVERKAGRAVLPPLGESCVARFGTGARE